MSGPSVPASRSTFRPASEGTAWQRQLRDRYLENGTPPIDDLSLRAAVVRPVSYRLAEQVILRYEWLGTMSKTSHHYGIFWGTWCGGVTCVAHGGGAIAGSHAHEQFGIDPQGLAILARGACVHWAPPGANSKLVSWTCRLLAKTTRAKVLMAFADTDAGEIGTIYQACNWAYLGRGKPQKDLVAPNGRIYNRKLIGDLAIRAGCSWREELDALLAAGWKMQEINPKHRYVAVLDKNDRDLLARVEAMRLPYPKRGRSIEGDAAGHQPEDGRAPSDPTAPTSSPTNGPDQPSGPLELPLDDRPESSSPGRPAGRPRRGRARSAAVD